jgi:hypothetical protein
VFKTKPWRGKFERARLPLTFAPCFKKLTAVSLQRFLYSSNYSTVIFTEFHKAPSAIKITLVKNQLNLPINFD